jgi:hypothetical protein
VLGESARPSELRVTVVSGEVALTAAGETAPVIVRADEQVRYDPRGARPVAMTVRAEEHTLWRLPEDRLHRLAAEHLGALFGAKATPQQQDRIRLDYDFVSSRELVDWNVEGTGWTLMLNALRCRKGEGVMVSRVAFVGDVEVEFGVNMERQNGAWVGWQLRPAISGGFDPLAAVARWQGGSQGRLGVSLAFGPVASHEVVGATDGPIFRFGGRLEGNRTLVSLVGQDVIDAATPDAILKSLHDTVLPQPSRLVVQAGGDDVFITHLTVIGRPDVQWLRRRLQQLVDERLGEPHRPEKL